MDLLTNIKLINKNEVIIKDIKENLLIKKVIKNLIGLLKKKRIKLFIKDIYYKNLKITQNILKAK